MLTLADSLFYVLAFGAAVSALLVIVVSNPIYSALFLALSMSALGALFFTLEAYFVSVAQITVYAGAVMVLFVMVLMLFDLKNDREEVFKISPLNIVKLFSSALLCGFLIGTSWLAVSAISSNPAAIPAAGPLPPRQNADNAHRPEDDDLTTAEQSSLVDKATVITPNAEEFGSTSSLSKLLFTNYVFAFEAVSLLLLVAIVGSVALARSKGGTHHVSK